MKEPIELTINGVKRTLDTDGDRPLLWVLRADLGLTGTKYGCGIGLCGSCTVLIDGVAHRSCQTYVSEVAGKEVTTIEGLAAGESQEDLHPVQQAFMEHDALQCGYCTPGMIMQGVSLLNENPDPSTEEVVESLEGNLCRCGAHKRIIQAMHTAAKMKGGR